jgi:6-phosphogluconolactonase (cycloisomerase 2 family)
VIKLLYVLRLQARTARVALLVAAAADHERDTMSKDMREKRPGSSEFLHRRAFLHMTAVALTEAAIAGGIPEIAAAQKASSAPHMSRSKSKEHPQDGHLYMQTNETRNAIVHYHRSAGGSLTELERLPTGGAGSGVFKPISGQESAPNAFEGAGSVILSPDRQFLFTTNGGDNTVSSFSVGEDGKLALLDLKPTGNSVQGRSGTAKSLAYSTSKRMLFVLHAFGPDHLRLMSINGEGKLTARPERYTVNTEEKTDRVPSMGVLSPDGKFLLVGTTFDQPPVRTGSYPDGSPVLWLRRPDGKFKVIASNAPDPDGIVVFPLQDEGTLGTAQFCDAKAASPFYIAFLNNRPHTFVVGYAVGDGCDMGTIDEEGKISLGQLVKIDTSAGRPSELCWLAVSPDDRLVFTTNFGYSNISSCRINGAELSIAKDPACPKVPGDGTFRAIDGSVSSGPSDSWITPDGAHLYQIYGNASKLVGYATHHDGSLTEITSVKIPYNCPQGLAGF